MSLRSKYAAQPVVPVCSESDSVPKDCAEFAHSVFEDESNNIKVLSAVEAVVQWDICEEFALPASCRRRSKRNFDYSVLKDVPGLILDAAGMVKAYFRNCPEEIADISLESKTPFISIGGQQLPRAKATKEMARKTNQENPSNAYQWSAYWFVAEGKHAGKSFAEVVKKVPGGGV